MPPQQVSHYRLTERLGVGTYGEVWKGVHVHDPALLAAVKLIHPALAGDPAFLASLKAECRLLSRLNHPHIVGFRELTLSDTHPPAMVLELVDGTTLETVLSQGPQPIDTVVSVVTATLSGLAHAHEEGVVHRDIKPGNLLMDRRGRVRLVDFGIARAADSGQATKTGTIQGTLDYLAPEVFQGKKAGPAVDLYAVGLVAWELLAGRRACPDGPLAAKMGWHLGVGLPDVRTVRPDCPVWLAEVVATLGWKDESARPANGNAALAMLESVRSAAGETPSRGPRSPRVSAPSTVTVDRTSLPPASTQPASSRTNSSVSVPETVQLVQAEVAQSAPAPHDKPPSKPSAPTPDPSRQLPAKPVSATMPTPPAGYPNVSDGRPTPAPRRSRVIRAAIVLTVVFMASMPILLALLELHTVLIVLPEREVSSELSEITAGSQATETDLVASTVTINSEPAGVRLTLDGKRLGRTPVVVPVPADDVLVELCAEFGQRRNCQSLTGAALSVQESYVVTLGD